MSITWLILLSCLKFCIGYNLPGVIPRDYPEGFKIEIQVNHLDSSKTQLPFDYYYLNYCKPDSLNPANLENIGEILSGSFREPSPYYIEMNIEKQCVQVCPLKRNTKEQQANFRWMIDNMYFSSWILDNLPSALRQTITYDWVPQRISYYQDGFPIGFKKSGKYYIYNHVIIYTKVYYTGETWRIVGFLVEPMSLNHKDTLVCDSEEFSQFIQMSKKIQERILPPPDEETNMEESKKIYSFENQELEKDIIYTYSTIFEESNIKWASRWDMYLYGAGKRSDVRWLSILNSFALVLSLSGIIAHILCRTIRKDITRYKDTAELDLREAGWKQIQGEIFRKPAYPGFFCIVIGSGVQLIFISLFGLTFACMGFLSPTYRGEFITTTFIVYIILGLLAGYTTARLTKMFDLKYWKLIVFGTAIFFPGTCLIIFFIINISVMTEESSGAVPFSMLFSLIFIWLGASISFVFLGGGLGYWKDTIQNPCQVNNIPRPITYVTSWTAHSLYFLAGSLPFGSMFIELSHVMKTIWHHTLFYYLFGFLFLCFIFLMITSAEVSILMIYILLCKEDYRWWWASFEVAGSSGIYFFMYSFAYYYTELNFSRVSSFIFYFGYMLLASTIYALITGTIGFIAAFIFIRTIYSLIKCD